MYNNSGYVLLGYLIEVLSSQSYAYFLQKHIFNPLGMQDSGYDSHTEIISHRADGYTKDDVGIVTNADYLDMSLPYAAGSLYSTTEDLLKWTQGLFNEKLLSPQSLDKMTQPFKESYGFGVEISQTDGIKMISHIGGINGFNTMLIYCPETKISIVVLSNLNTIGYVWDIGFLSKNIALKLAALAHGRKIILPREKRETRVSSSILEQYVGLYQTKPNMNLDVILENGQLKARFAEQSPILLLAESDTVFYAKIPDMELKFLKNEKNTITQVNLSQSGYELLGTKV